MKNRDMSLDILRSVAAIAVVIFHVLGSAANNDPAVPANTYTVVTAITNTLQWHVPVFFMITGYLWLQDNKECTFRKMIPNIRRFCCVLFTVGFAYAVMERFFDTRSLSVLLFIYSITDVLTGNLWDHMWYMYAIIGIYLVLPILKTVYINRTKYQLEYLVCLLFTFAILEPIIYQITGYEIPVDIPASSSLFYVCLGGLLSQKTQRRCIVAPILGFCFGTVIVFLATMYTETLDLWLPVIKCILAVSLFVVVTAVSPMGAEPKWLRTFSDCTFGIYLIHPFFINAIIKLFHIYPLQYLTWVSLPLSCLIIIFLSFLSTYILRHISFVKKYIL